MTAIPRSDNGRRPRFILICDDCGRNGTIAPIASTPETWPVLWSNAHSAGWRGRDRPIGPHCCPTCAAPSTTDHRS